MQLSTNTPLISIIVPAYNAADFIEKSIGSVQNQTYTNIEIIIVNDGSKDSTESKCLAMQSNDSRIKLYTIPNGGASNARSYGVKQAIGEFITFLDADDSLKENAIQVLYSAMSEDVSIVAISERNEIISVDDYRIKILTQKIVSAPWGKLFRKKLFSNFVFDMPRELIRGEDFVMNMRLAYNDDLRIATITNNIYIYTPQIFSITKTFKYNKSHELLFYKELKRSFLNHNKYSSYILNMRLATYKDLLWLNISDSEEQTYLLTEYRKSATKVRFVDLLILKVPIQFIGRFLVFLDKLIAKLK